VADLQADPAARFQQIYAQSYRSLVGYARRRTSSAEDAADVVAETFLVAWRRVDVIPPGDDATPWLYGVARNVISNQVRGARRRERLTHRLQFELTPVPVDGPETVQTSITDEALARLSEGDRELLRLMAWEGLEASEIAVALGFSSGTVRVRLSRARRRFAQHLREASGQGVRAPTPGLPPLAERNRGGDRHNGQA
jgi:RNA polymerase sigma-70 factor (ECF subfamily)